MRQKRKLKYLKYSVDLGGCARVPQIVEVGDYHDFEDLQESYRKLVPGIKVREINSDPEKGCYVGIVYAGNLKSPRNRDLLREETKRLKKINDNFDWSMY